MPFREKTVVLTDKHVYQAKNILVLIFKFIKENIVSSWSLMIPFDVLLYKRMTKIDKFKRHLVLFEKNITDFL